MRRLTQDKAGTQLFVKLLRQSRPSQPVVEPPAVDFQQAAEPTFACDSRHRLHGCVESFGVTDEQANSGGPASLDHPVAFLQRGREWLCADNMFSVSGRRDDMGAMQMGRSLDPDSVNRARLAQRLHGFEGRQALLALEF